MIGLLIELMLLPFKLLIWFIQLIFLPIKIVLAIFGIGKK